MTKHHTHHHETHCEKIYILENLGCANCAAKMEQKINALSDVETATITFATKQLSVYSHCSYELLPVLQEICTSVEPEVIVKCKEESKGKESENAHPRKHEVFQIAVAILIFLFAFFIQETSEVLSKISFVVSYFILGWNILKSAGINLVKGHVFGENFLMSIATIAAFIIGDFAEAVGVMLFFRIGELFERIAVERSRSRIMEIVDLRPETVQLIHGHHTHEIPAAHAKIGDVLLVRVGDRIPLDGVVVEGESRIDTAAITGEPVPVKVKHGDSVISGCINTSGVLHIRVEQKLENSMVTRILHSVEHAAANKPKIDRFITRFARVYTPVVVLLAMATAIVPSLVTGEWNHWIYTAITFLVISCPCALVLSVPLAFFAGIGTGSHKKILFKGGYALEALQQIKVVVMDKTGTITEGNFEVKQSVAYEPYTEQELLLMAMSCESQSTHPIAHSIVAFGEKQHLMGEPVSNVKEIAGKGICAHIKEDQVLCGNRSLLEMYDIKVEEYTLPKGGCEVLVACNGNMVGYFIIDDTIKAESKSAIAHLKKQGIKTVMLTGDGEQNAQAVANQVGVEEVYAQLLPEDKLARLQDIRNQYGKVLFVGDGINDAPVLAGADVGAAMGNGADAAIEAADVVFMTASMEAVPEALHLAKSTNAVAKQNIVLALSLKVLVMILGILGFANMWMAVFADTGVAMLCVLNSIRILGRK